MRNRLAWQKLTKSNSDYLLTIDADAYTPVDSTFMTTDEIVSVEATHHEADMSRLIIPEDGETVVL